jgi:hypothetical protein
MWCREIARSGLSSSLSLSLGLGLGLGLGLKKREPGIEVGNGNMQEVDDNTRFWRKPELPRQAAAFEAVQTQTLLGEEHIMAADSPRIFP